MILILWGLNFWISWSNAWGCGSTWDSTRARGGIAHFMNWMGVIMSAAGFTWCYLVLLGLLGAVTPMSWVAGAEEGVETKMLLDATALQAFFDLGYLVIIFPILGSGLAITISTWRSFARSRQRRFGDYAIVGWNTFAQVENTISAMREVPGVLDRLWDFFPGSDGGSDSRGKGKVQLIVVVLVAMAICAGCLTTYSILQARRRAVILDDYNRTLEAA